MTKIRKRLNIDKILKKVNYKQFNITREERIQENIDIQELEPYILALKERDLGELKCEQCGEINEPLDIHHRRYGTDVNYYDLALLCPACHKAIQPSRYDN